MVPQVIFGTPGDVSYLRWCMIPLGDVWNLRLCMVPQMMCGTPDSVRYPTGCMVPQVMYGTSSDGW